MIKNVLAAFGAISLVAWIVLASPAMGSAPLAPGSTLTSDDWPPVRFQGDGASTVIFVAPALIDPLCGKAPAGYQTEACQSGDQIILPNPCVYPKTDDYARLVCHEHGHSNGWPATHGQAVRLIRR